MEINIGCINNELRQIISNKKKYNNEIILHALATLELLTVSKETNVISYEMVKLLTYLREFMRCYIDFDLLNYVSNNNKKITFIDTLQDKLGSSDSSTQSINTKINKMITEDTNMMKNIIENKLTDFDIYGSIDIKTLELSKKLFNILDADKDGYISALDAIRILKICKKYPLAFENNFDDTIVYLLTSQNDNKMDFNAFFHLFI